MTQADELNEMRKHMKVCDAGKGDTSATIVEMNQLAESIALMRKEEEAASDVKKGITARLELAENAVLELLQKHNLKSYRAPAGLLGLSFRTSVKTPKTPEARAALYDHLRAIGKYDDMISVNSQTLNSFYKERLELAKEEGKDDFEIPGITEVTVNAILSFRKS